MKKSFLSLIILLLTTLILFLYDVQPSQATTYKFELHGHDGYGAKVLFSYDEKRAPEAFSEFGTGKTNALESLVVTFFDPLGKTIATYNNVVNGISNQDYLRFNFDTNTKELFGFFDVGAYKTVPGNIFFKGKIDKNLEILQFDRSGLERAIDSSSGSVIVSQVRK